MSTRSELFKLWSDDSGYGFFLGHNKMRHENSVNMLTKVIEKPSILVDEKQVPTYEYQDCDKEGKITIGMLAMQPIELFPLAFQLDSAFVELTFLKRSIVFTDMQIKTRVIGIVKQVRVGVRVDLNHIIDEVKKGTLSYKLYRVSGKRNVNADLIDESKVYVEISKNKSLATNIVLMENLLDAAAYRISDEDFDEDKIGKKQEFKFYFKEKDKTEYKTKKIEIKNIATTVTEEGKQKLYDRENKLTKWICLRMAKSLNAYDTWYEMLEVNKKKAMKNGYDAEKVEYLESILSWSLNSYVMLQNKEKEIPKLSYLDLQYADRELKKL